MFRILFALVVFTSVTAITSCKKDNFDEPPITIPEPPEKLLKHFLLRSYPPE